MLSVKKKPKNLTILCLSLWWMTTATSHTYDIITNPQISQKCKELLKHRKNKIELKQKSISLIRRSEKLMKNTPQEKKSIHLKVNFILSQLNQEKRILEEKIDLANEEIIRQGCPGITL